MSINSYASASEYLGSKQDRPLTGRATRLQRREDGTIAVQYQQTDVVVYRPDGQIVLQTGGWLTPTTKDRIGTYSPALIYQVKGVWYVAGAGADRYDTAGSSLFYDGMIIKADGQPKTPKQVSTKGAARKRQLDQAVTKYIKGFAALIAAGELQAPGGGDCWGCLMQVKDAAPVVQGAMRRERPTPHGRVEPMGVGHYLEHMGLGGDPSEVYYVPSLMFNAILARGYRDPRVIWHLLTVRTDSRMATGILRAYFKDLKPALLEAFGGVR